MTLNSWPALHTSVYEGWLLRFANGYTKRANSVSPLYGDEDDDICMKVSYCEDVYKEAGQAVIFKITPYGGAGALDDYLEQCGYERVEPSCVQVRSLAGLERPTLQAISVNDVCSEEWLGLYASLSGMSERNIRTAQQLLQAGRCKKGFFTLNVAGRPIAVGIGIIESGYVGLYDIIVEKASRNRGYAEQLILHILQWAVENGAEHSFLQVVQSNEPALKLYSKLGYKMIYPYWYRVKKLHGD